MSSSSLHSFPVLLPPQMREHITRDNKIGYFDIGVPLHLIRAEIIDRLFVNEKDQWAITKSWHELLVADGHVVVEKDGEPVRFLDDVLKFHMVPQEKSDIYFDYDRMVPYHLRHRSQTGKVVYESPEYQVRLVQGKLSELGGSRWSQRLLVADNQKWVGDHAVSIKGRIVGVDDHPVKPGGEIVDDRGNPIGRIAGYKVVDFEPPRPDDTWRAPLPLHLTAG